MIELGEDRLRTVGLSGAKARYVSTWPRPSSAGEVPLDEFDDSWDDEAIIAALTAVKGIGVWTAEMFLIFVMNRPDVLPAGDLGVRAALRERHGLAQLPAPRECHALAETWRPYRTHRKLVYLEGHDTPKPDRDRPNGQAPNPGEARPASMGKPGRAREARDRRHDI